MTDFGPLLANPRTLLLGVQGQMENLAVDMGYTPGNYFGLISFTLPQAAAIGIIGGADGPTAIYLSGKLAPELLGAIAVAAYSYMALVPLIQPPIMKALTTETERKIRIIGIIGGADGPTAIYLSGKLMLVALLLPDAAAYSYMALVPLIQPPIMKALTTETERKIRMVQLRTVSKREKILFPVVLLMLVALLLPDAAPLLGMFCFGNLMRESGVVERLSD
ncbi:sodium ion-translocating decarboxylase subunit beta, partial [Salmonella enterica]|uniref:sodium ion-translocating decarboxylase subunit beta n=1 Tax=Salmonella enterica TaxID=28901 RepID=UPI003CD01ABD